MYDHIQSDNKKLQDFKLTNELVNSREEAHQRYIVAIEENKLSVIKNHKKVKRKLIDDEINDVKKRKLDLETCVDDKLSFEVEQKNDLTLLIKANFFRKTATEKAESVSVFDKATWSYMWKRKIWRFELGLTKY